MGNAWHSLFPVRHPYPGRERSEAGKPNPVGMKKNVPWHIRASRAVACDMFLLRASAHPRGTFYMLLFTHTCPVTEFAVASHLNTANSCCHHVFLRHFRFQKCLPVYSNPIFPNPQSLQRNYERRQSRLFPYEPLQLIQIRRPPDLIVEAVLLDPAHRLRKCLFLLLIV